MSGESSSKVMLNNKRLSAMIDSLQKEDIENELLKIGKPTSPDRADPIKLTHQEPSDSKNSSPSKMFRSPGGLVSLQSAGNRASMLSDYSGVVQEGIGISYVVQNQGKKMEENDDHPNLPALPSVETLGLNDTFENKGYSRSPTDDLVIETVPNAKPVERLSSSYSKGSRTSKMSHTSEVPGQEPSHESNSSLRLLSINKHHLAPSSVGSGNLASESGSSYYNHQRNDEKRVSVPQSEESHESYSSKNPDHSWNSDNVSIVTSIIPPLSTTIRDDHEGLPPTRSETASYNPTVPPRSKNRPTSRLFIRDTLDDIENQLMEQMRDPEAIQKNAGAITRSSSNTNHSDTYFSATSYQISEQDDSHELLQETDKLSDDKYLERPLPEVPSTLRRDSTIRAQSQQDDDTEHSTEKPTFENDDDMYEDLDITVQPAMDKDKNRTSINAKSSDGRKSKPKASPKKKQGRKKKQELRSFDVDTLSQLLNVTKGTLIGSEFANLGMKIEEKRALERLVDSLSRLTADMVLDPDRYEEGLRRLDKATKALEGF